MSTERKRITINLTKEAFQRLEQLAEQRGKRYGSVANQILTDLLHDGTVPPASGGGGDGPQTPGSDGELPAWLELDRGRAWRVDAWETAMRLRADYPTELHFLPSDWTDDRFARDGVLALAAWRAQIDGGSEDDPRVELAWLDSLRRFRGWLEQRSRETRDLPPCHAAPASWRRA